MKIAVLVVPYDSGRCDERMGRGPARLLAAIAPVLARAGHDVRTFEIAVSGAFPAEIAGALDMSAIVAARVRDLRRDGWFPLVLSGNCNTAVGAVSGCGCRRTDVVWFDAHGEATTPETTTSGFLDGMGISILTGACWRTIAASIPDFEPLPGERVSLIGSRDLEPSESALLDRLGVHRAGCRHGRRPSASARKRRRVPAFRSRRARSDRGRNEPLEPTRRPHRRCAGRFGRGHPAPHGRQRRGHRLLRSRRRPRWSRLRQPR